MSRRWWQRTRTSRRWLAELWTGALDLALPPACAGCRAPIAAHEALCEACDRQLPRLAKETCVLCQVRVCQVRMCQATLTVDNGLALCAACEFSRSPLDACIAAATFSQEVANWIHRFKYPRRGLAGLDPAPRSVVEALVLEAAGEAARRVGSPPDLIVPVPLHSSRLRSRGFNPAQLLARAVARRCRVDADPVALERLRATPSQTGLDREQRRRNVRGAFRARRPSRTPARIWLVDDVVTTGSTLAECARALRRAGAETVVGICAARALGE